MGAGLIAAGVSGQIVGAGLRAEAARKAAAAQAGQDDANATLAEQAGASAIAAGDVAGEKANIRSGHAVAEGTQQYATSGVDTASGSPLDVLGDAKMIGTLDDMTIRNNAFRQAMGYKVEAINYRRRGDYTLKTGGDQLAATVVGGLTGAASSSAPLLRIGRSSEPVATQNDLRDPGDYEEANELEGIA